MSRSIKKNLGGSITGAGMKKDQTIYHQNERSKVNGILKEVIKENGEGDAADKLVKNKIDYGVKYSDNYSWDSDGGSYIRDTDKSLAEYFDNKVMKDPHLWQEYRCHFDKYKRGYIMGIAFDMAGDNFDNEDSLRFWLSENRDRILRAVKKIEYGK